VTTSNYNTSTNLRTLQIISNLNADHVENIASDRFSIVAHLFIAMDMCLPRRYLLYLFHYASFQPSCHNIKSNTSVTCLSSQITEQP
jgi:hypothetical protein